MKEKINWPTIRRLSKLLGPSHLHLIRRDDSVTSPQPQHHQFHYHLLMEFIFKLSINKKLSEQKMFRKIISVLSLVYRVFHCRHLLISVVSFQLCRNIEANNLNRTLNSVNCHSSEFLVYHTI